MINQEDIIGFDALFESMNKCRRNVTWKDSVAAFVLDPIKRIKDLSRELKDGTYVPGEKTCFTVTYPKERKIVSIPFRDRVYQRSLNDVAIYPAIARRLIYDNAACQKGKGADFSRNRMKCHLQRYYRKHGADGYFLKMDIAKYYDSMRHDVAKSVFRKYLDDDTYRRAEEILDSFPGDVGFSPGSQIIQIAGISVLNDLDHYIKERLHIKHYMRYMDDMVVIGQTEEELQEVRGVIEKQLNDIGFNLHPEKTKIVPLRKGILWLGFIYRVKDNGKVVMTLDPDNVRAARKKYYRLAKKAKAGRIPRKKVDESYRCWRNNAAKGDGYNMLCKMDKYYQSLWGDNNAENSKKDSAVEHGRNNQPSKG